jgi:hypothetical protein
VVSGFEVQEIPLAAAAGRSIPRRRDWIPLTPNMVGARLTVEFAAWVLHRPVRPEQLDADRVEHFLG